MFGGWCQPGFTNRSRFAEVTCAYVQASTNQLLIKFSSVLVAQSYARIQLSSGQEATVELRDVAPIGHKFQLNQNFFEIDSSLNMSFCVIVANQIFPLIAMLFHPHCLKPSVAAPNEAFRCYLNCRQNEV